MMLHDIFDTPEGDLPRLFSSTKRIRAVSDCDSWRDIEYTLAKHPVQKSVIRRAKTRIRALKEQERKKAEKEAARLHRRERTDG